MTLCRGLPSAKQGKPFYIRKRGKRTRYLLRPQGVVKWLTVLFTPSLPPLACIESTV